MMKANRIIQVSTVSQLVRWWDFFKEGLKFLNSDQKWRKSNEEFLEALLYIVSQGEENSFIGVLVSFAGQPYGFVVVTNNTTRFSKRSCNIFALYSNSKCPSTITELAAEVYQWARTHGYEEAQACSHRVNGSAIRWFQRNMKFDSMFMVFSKKI